MGVHPRRALVQIVKSDISTNDRQLAIGVRRCQHLVNLGLGQALRQGSENHPREVMISLIQLKPVTKIVSPQDWADSVYKVQCPSVCVCMCAIASARTRSRVNNRLLVKECIAKIENNFV